MKQVRGTLNSVSLIGWMGGDPELRLTSNGHQVCRFTLATRRVAGSDEQGQRHYETEWTTVEAWERLAEQCNTYLHKGSRVMIGGSLRTDSWTDKESGQARTKVYVRADDVIFLDARNESSGEATSEESDPPC